MTTRLTAKLLAPDAIPDAWTAFLFLAYALIVFSAVFVLHLLYKQYKAKHQEK
jgi:hypothetical protein